MTYLAGGVGILVACALAGWTLWALSSQQGADEMQDTPLDYSDAAARIGEESSDRSVDELLSEYEQYYDASVGELRHSDPASWDQTMLDRAFLSFLYAERTGMYRSAESIATLIDVAKFSGVKIDENSAGVSDEAFKQLSADVSQKLDEQQRQREARG